MKAVTLLFCREKAPLFLYLVSNSYSRAKGRDSIAICTFLRRLFRAATRPSLLLFLSQWISPCALISAMECETPEVYYQFELKPKAGNRCLLKNLSNCQHQNSNGSSGISIIKKYLFINLFIYDCTFHFLKWRY